MTDKNPWQVEVHLSNRGHLVVRKEMNTEAAIEFANPLNSVSQPFVRVVDDYSGETWHVLAKDIVAIRLMPCVTETMQSLTDAQTGIPDETQT